MIFLMVYTYLSMIIQHTRAWNRYIVEDKGKPNIDANMDGLKKHYVSKPNIT